MFAVTMCGVYAIFRKQHSSKLLNSRLPVVVIAVAAAVVAHLGILGPSRFVFITKFNLNSG